MEKTIEKSNINQAKTIRNIIDQDIKDQDRGYGLQTHFQTPLPKIQGTKFITMSGEEISLDSNIQNSKIRTSLIQEFKKALLELDAQKIKKLLYKNDFETPFIVYETKEDGYVIRKGPYSYQELMLINPLPTLIKNYIEKNGPMRFDQYWEIAQYFPTLGIYNKVRHFETFFESASSKQQNTEYSMGITAYILAHASKEQKIRIVECGAGTGEGMLRILTALKHTLKIKTEVYILETSETLRLTQKHKLNRFNVKWVDQIEQIPNNNTLTFITSEMFLDSFPYRILKKEGKFYKDAYLTKDGLIYDDKGVNESDPLIAEIKNVKEWPDDSLIIRSIAAENYFEKLLTYFKRFIFLSCDHIIRHMTSFHIGAANPTDMQVPLHLVSSKQTPVRLHENAGEFFLACSLYLPLYQKILDKMNHVNYQFFYAKDFFKKIGGYVVYPTMPQFVTMVVHSKE